MDEIHTILLTIQKYEMSHGNLVLFLKGSPSKHIQKYSQLQGFGGLYWLSKLEVEHIITQLYKGAYLAKKRVVTKYGSYEVYTLTQNGLTTLQTQQKVVVAPYVYIPTITPTIKKTLVLAQSNVAPKRIAELRNLALSTIYAHLRELILNGDLDATQFVSSSDFATVQSKIRSGCSTSLKHLKEECADMVYLDLFLIQAQIIREPQKR